MKKSAGILLFRRLNELQVFLVHPGGPFWKNKDAGAWSIPKGEFADSEDALQAAIREFEEETGQKINGDFHALTPIKQKGGKMVYAWALEGDADAQNISSNTFQQEWPYKSGKIIAFPEVDKACWFGVDEAREKINTAQASFINELEALLASK